MPWNDQNGGEGGPWGSGGSGNGNKNGSPWGRPSGGGQQNQDLEDQIRKVQDRFRGKFGGGGGSGSGGSGKGFGFLGVGLLVIVLGVAWLLTGVVIVDAREQAAVFQFGKWQRNLPPGFHVHLPRPIESHEIIPVEAQQEVRIGNTKDQSLMLTQDENIADVQFSVFWKVKSDEPQNFVLNVKEPEKTVPKVAESVMREVVGKSQLQNAITIGRDELSRLVKLQTQALLDEYEAGIEITNVEIAKIDPPEQVIKAFNDVNVAQQDAEQLINQAQRFANQIVPEARGEASRILQEAEAYRDQTIANATGEASRFNQILTEYKQAPRVTKERMYLETMERVLKRTDKLILDNESGAVPYLPITPKRGTEN